MEEKNSKCELTTCKKCGHFIKYNDEDTYWDESGYGYSVKLLMCYNCNTPNVIKYEEDNWIKD